MRLDRSLSYSFSSDKVFCAIFSTVTVTLSSSLVSSSHMLRGSSLCQLVVQGGVRDSRILRGRMRTYPTVQQRRGGELHLRRATYDRYHYAKSHRRYY